MSLRLRDVRRDRGMDLAEFAAQVHISPSTIAKYERGEVVPSAARAKRIADYFGVKQSEFWPTPDPSERSAA